MVIILSVGSFILFLITTVLIIKLLNKDKEILRARKDAIERSRAVLEGKIAEQLVPYFPQFSHSPSDIRFLGSPIDFIAFDGMSTGNPTGITIIEVKTGHSSTTPLQNKIKKLVEEGKVTWELLKL